MMKSRVFAALFAFLFSIAMFIVPFVPILGVAVIALVTLKNGWLEGLLTAVLAAALVLLSFATLGMGMQDAVIFIILTWTSALVLAELSRRGGSIASGINLVLLPALLVWLVLNYYIDGSPYDFWQTYLTQNILPAFKDAAVNAKIIDMIQNDLPNHMSGMIIASFVFILLAALLLARLWQSILYNPGGFGKEFRTLRLGRNLAIIATVIIAIALFNNENLLIFKDFRLAAIWVFLLQGLAVAHFFFQQKDISALFIMPFYIMLVFFPLSAMIIAIFGIADNWLNFRKKIQDV